VARQQIRSDKLRQPSGVFSHATAIETKGWGGPPPPRGGGGDPGLDPGEPEGADYARPSTMLCMVPSPANAGRSHRTLPYGSALLCAREVGEGNFDRGLAPNPDRSLRRRASSAVSLLTCRCYAADNFTIDHE